MKSQIVFLSFCVSVCFTFSVFSQDVARFQANDVAAINLSAEVLEQLTDKKWYLHTLSYIEKGKTDDHRFYRPGNYAFLSGGVCQQPEIEGRWTTNRQNNLLLITSDSLELAKKWTHLLVGGYAIYRLTESELILGKVLTSTFDTKFLYCFENKERHEQREAARKSQRQGERVRRQAENKEVWVWDKKKEELILKETKSKGRVIYGDELTPMTKADLFMRNIKPEPGYVYFLDTEGNVIKIGGE